MKATRNVTAGSSPTGGDIDIGFNFKAGTIITHVAVVPSAGTAAGPCYAVIFVGDSSMAMPLAEGWIRMLQASVAGTADARLDAVHWNGRLDLGDWAGSQGAPSVGAFVHNDTGAAINVVFGVSYEVA